MVHLGTARLFELKSESEVKWMGWDDTVDEREKFAKELSSLFQNCQLIIPFYQGKSNFLDSK